MTYFSSSIFSRSTQNTLCSKSSCKILAHIGISISLLSLSANYVFAAEENSAKLSPLISIAHPTNNANISVVESSFVRNTQASDLREVFAKDAEIQVGGSSKIAQKLYIRGFEDRMFRIKLNGITQGGNLFHHQGNLLFSPYLLKSIEIEKGLASVEYGANAFAGGITITTKNAFDLLETNRNYGAYFSIGGQSNRGIDSNVATYGKIADNLGLLVSYDFNDTPYYRAGNGSKVPSSQFQAHNALFKLTYLPNENHSLNLNYHFNMIDSTSPYAANVIAGENPMLFDNALIAHSASMQYGYTLGDRFKLEWNNYYSHKSLGLSPKTIATAQSEEEGEMDLSLQNLGSDLILRHSFGEHHLKYGLNYQLIASQADNLEGHALEHGNRGKEMGAVYGGFVGFNVNMLDSLSLDFGSRYDVYNYQDKISQTHNTQGFSPYISLFYAATNDLSFKLTHNYNTRGAMPLDVSLLTNPHSLVRSRLKAEGIYNTELNMDYDNSVLSLHASVYYQYLKNFINSYTNDGAEHNHGTGGNTHAHEDMYRANTDRHIEILGYEASAGLDFSFVDFHIGLAQSMPKYNNKLITDTFEFAAVSGRSYYASVGLRPFSSLPQFQILYLTRFVEGLRYQGYNLYYNDIDSVDKKGYNTHNIYINYDASKYLSVRLAFLNITNQTYTNPMSPAKELFAKESGSPLYEPGFNTKLQIALSF